MFNLSTISQKEVISAYETSGLYPIFGEWGDGKTCGCAITVLAAVTIADKDKFQALLDAQDETLSEVAKELGINESLLIAFVNGYDQIAIGSNDDEALQVFQRGLDIRKAVRYHFSLDD